MLVVQDYAPGAAIDRQPAAARVINKGNLPEFVAEIGIDTGILSIVVFPTAFTPPRERPA
jgi:hypothetical protein